MTTALFINISDKPFTGYWDGKPKTFQPGEQMYMEEFLARHFAKHLTNKLLLEKGDETSTSPKRPEQVPAFMEIFNQICKIEPEKTMNELESQIDLANKNVSKATETEMEEAPKPKTRGRKKSTEKVEPEQTLDDENAEFKGLNS